MKVMVLEPLTCSLEIVVDIHIVQVDNAWVALNQVDRAGSDGILQRARKDVYSDDVSTCQTEPDT
jgi:hypothetical protein